MAIRSSTTLPRDSKGQLQKFAFPGGYPIFYIDRDNQVQCPDCAEKNAHPENRGYHDEPVACEINYEDGMMFCDVCSEQIESAYADDKPAQEPILH